MAAWGAIPADYYAPLDGKGGDALVKAISGLAGGHTVIAYNTKTWDAFETTDVRQVNGRDVWWDMYSNNIVYLPEHAALNIEHSVANSWWGGKSGSNEAYSDLFHLNPSDQNANNRKGNNPPGMVADARILDNGLIRIGTPAEGQGGGAASVFEPADEYKGDFARAYFYVFATYGDLAWKDEHAYVYDSDGRLQSWAAEVLLSWHRQDPVDSKELNRNEAVYALQGNRNPFIDYPELADYVWGPKAGEEFRPGASAPAEAADRPEAPVFRGMRTVGINTYAGRWWDGKAIEIGRPSEVTLMVSLDGAPYRDWTADDIVLDPAADGRERHRIKAYTEAERGGYTLRSATATLDMYAADPSVTDYSTARWERVSDASLVTAAGGPYIILSSNTFHAMSVTGGTASTAFLESAGLVELDDDMVVELPAGAAVVTFEEVGGGKMRLMVNDVNGSFKGSWNSTAKNKMRLDDVTYTPGVVSMNLDGSFVFTFDQYGRLQYNASQPRFLNYESSQKPVYLYRFKDFDGGWSGVGAPAPEAPEGIGVGAGTITVGPGSRIFDLGGRAVDGRNLTPGIYIVVTPSGVRKIAL